MAGLDNTNEEIVVRNDKNEKSGETSLMKQDQNVHSGLHSHKMGIFHWPRLVTSITVLSVVFLFQPVRHANAAETMPYWPSGAPILASSPPLCFHSVGPNEQIKPGMFDVKYFFNPWWTMARFSISDEVLARHSISREMLQRLTLLDGHFDSLVITEPYYIVNDKRYTHLDWEAAVNELPPFRARLPEAIWLWTRQESIAEKAERIKAIYRFDRKMLQVSFEKDQDRELGSLVGYRVYSSTDVVPMLWHMLIMEPTDDTEDPWIPIVSYNTNGVWTPHREGREAGPNDRLGASIAARLGNTPLPLFSLIDTDSASNKAQIKNPLCRWDLLMECPIPWRKKPALFYYNAVVYNATGLIEVFPEGTPAICGFPVFAQPDGRFWIIPPMSPNNELHNISCSAAIDTNQDNAPDLLLMDWYGDESCGSAILLIDDKDLYFILSSGGFYYA